MLMHMLNVTVGMTFSGGLIDLALFGVIPGNAKTNWMYIIPVGAVYFVLYYFLFKFAILKFNFMTPGREEDELESKLYTRKDFEASKQDNTSELIIEGLGGVENIESLDCCATRLRVKVYDIDKVSDEILKLSGAAGMPVKQKNYLSLLLAMKVFKVLKKMVLTLIIMIRIYQKNLKKYSVKMV